ncbi:replicative DNA helicase [Ornithobacterium rhinotracheale]|uniref:replicative DNA helicase n=1 Tax=Ornithobacterium rhinotracheale TaxID=28251 RepID=UPI00129CD187|nr:replicative DNA helicase [Ornithobacterium rhinotracheale]MRJ09695.1 replicative DNA helicase [Ornithobacterium rhinotracheale]
MNNAPEIETKVLSSIINFPYLFTKHKSKLSLDLFTKHEHRQLFTIINDLWENNVSFDIVVIENEVRKTNNKLLLNLTIDLIADFSSATSFEHSLMILVDLSAKRDFVNKFSRLLQLAQNPAEDIFHIRDLAFEYFDDLFLKKFIDRNKESQKFSYLVEKVQERFENIQSNSITGIKSSLSIINKALGGWQNSDLTIVAGRPGMGKTAFLVQQAVDVVRQGKSVGIFSLEMSSEQITGRIVTNYTQIPNSSILRKGLKADEYQKFFALKPELLNLKVHIDDTPSMSIQDMRMKAKMMKLRDNIDILFVDYLQLATHEKSNNREQEISTISRGLKAIAKELNIPVVALSQLSRNVEKRPDKRPMLSDLRDSGAIEQDADEVMFLYRPEYYGIDFWGDEYDLEPTHNQVELIIQKNRHGGILSERYGVDFPTSRFYPNNEDFFI